MLLLDALHLGHVLAQAAEQNRVLLLDALHLGRVPVQGAEQPALLPLDPPDVRDLGAQGTHARAQRIGLAWPGPCLQLAHAHP